MIVILFIAILILYLIILSDLVFTTEECNTKVMTSSLFIEEAEDEDDDNDSMIVHTTHQHISHEDKRENDDCIVSNSMKCIQEHITFLVSDSNTTVTNKSILYDYLTTTNYSDVSYLLAQSLSRVSISKITDLTLPAKCVSLLTNCYRVSTSDELRNFILHSIHAVTPLKLNLEPLAYNQHLLTSTRDLDYERVSVSLLEKLNRLQVELWLTLPLFNTNNNISVPISPTTSTTTVSSHNSSHSSRTSFTSNHSTNTSVTTQQEDEYKLFNFKDIEKRITANFITTEDVIKFQTELYTMKSTIQDFIEQQDITVYQDRLDQVEYAIKSIIKNCNHMESVLLRHYQSRFIFSQLCEFITECLRATRNYIDSIEMGSRQEINTLEEWIGLGYSLIESLKIAFITNNSQEGAAMYHDKYINLFLDHQELCDDYLEIYLVWHQIDTIKSRIQHEMHLLSTINIKDDYLSRNYDVVHKTLRHIQFQLHGEIQKDLTLTVEKVIMKQESCTSRHLSAHEKIISAMIDSVYLPLQQFKNQIMFIALQLKRYQNKQKLRKNIVQANEWIKEYKDRVIVFNLIDSLWSPTANNRVRQEEFVNLRMEFDGFIATPYNEICTGFVFNSDNQYLSHEYELFLKLQEKCDEINKLLKFCSQIQQQQKDVLDFINNIKQHTSDLVKVTTENELMDWQVEAERIYKESFQRIQWPTLLNFSHGKIIYTHSQALYLEVSKIKIDFISLCQQTNSVM